MFDARSEPREFVGASRSEAVAKATAFFQLAEEDLEIREFGPRQVFNLGARVLVVAKPREAAGGGRAAPAGRGGGRRERGRESGRSRAGAPPARESAARREEAVEPSAPSRATTRGDISPVGEFVRGVLERMDVGDFEIAEERDDEVTVITVGGPAARKLLAGDGRTLDALKLLAGQAALRMDEENAPRVVIEVEGQEEVREQVLEELAERAARRALKSGRSLALEPMNARERRIVHVALRDVDDVATMSIGSGRYRQVVVVPKGAPEWEEALEAERKAAERSRSD